MTEGHRTVAAKVESCQVTPGLRQNCPSACTNADCLALGCVAHRASERALRGVNTHLAIEARITSRGDELKCAIPDLTEGGLCKAYLTAADCIELAAAFTTLASVLERRRP